MAYTGTGTDVDPYVVTTFEDFLTCVGSVGSGAGAYVKIANDLDAAAEGFEYIEPIVVEAARVFADTKTKIKNVTITGVNMLSRGITSTVHDIYFENIHFQNWTLKNTTASVIQALNLSMDNTHHGKFGNCEFNVEIQAENEVFTLVNLDEFYHCSVYFEIFNATGFTICGLSSSDVVNGFIKSNFYFKFHNSKYSSNSNVLTVASYCGFILDGLAINYTAMSNLGNYGAGFSYIVFKDCTVATTCAAGGGQSSVLLCLDNTTGITSSNLPILTPEQLKSESYLQSIGWLP